MSPSKAARRFDEALQQIDVMATRDMLVVNHLPPPEAGDNTRPNSYDRASTVLFYGKHALERFLDVKFDDTARTQPVKGSIYPVPFYLRS